MSDVERKLQAMHSTYEAAQRLADLGLASNEDGNRGVNADGFNTFGDLATVLMMQGSQGSLAERVMSTTCRALLSTLAAVAAEAAGQPGQVAPQLQAAQRELGTATKLIEGAART